MSLLRIILAFASALLGLILVLPFVLLVIPLWALSVATRAGARLFRPAHVTMDQLMEYDPTFGWKPRPNLDTHHLNVDFFQLSTDADGWRGKVDWRESDVVAIGDSFAAGYGASDRDFFANLCASPRIKALGAGGYSQVQELLWLKRLAPSLQGKLVVWFIYYGNDLYDNLCPEMRGYRKPFVRESGEDGEWEIVSTHVRREPWPIVTHSRMGGDHYLPRLADLCSDTFLSKRAYSACEFLLREGRKVCHEADAQLVILSIPEVSQLSIKGHSQLKSLGGDETFNPDYPDLQLKAICGRLGLEFVPGRSFLDLGDYLSYDCHWNNRGNRRMAEALQKLYASRREAGASAESRASWDWSTTSSTAAAGPSIPRTRLS